MALTKTKCAWTCVILCAILASAAAFAEEPAGGATAPAAAAEVPSGPGLGSLEGTVSSADYILGPGDVILIGFWGEINRSDRVVINPDGDALVSPVGPLHVSGMPLAEARDLIRENLAPYYRPGVLSVSLVALRTFRVHVVGAVARPGALEANAVTRVSRVIADAGGLAEHGSERNIEIRRKGANLRVDLVRYLLLGDNGANPYLNDGDVVYVPPRAEQVYVYGSVYRQGGYEFIEGESLGDIIGLAGGLRPEAFTDSLEIQRFDSSDPTRSVTQFLSAGPAGLQQFKVASGDRIFVRSLDNWHEDAKVTISGEVLYPGVYVIEEGTETLTSLVARAGGFTERASLAEARLVRGAYASVRYPIEAGIQASGATERGLSEREEQLAQTLSREPKGALSISFEDVFAAGGGTPDLLVYGGDAIDVPRASGSVRVSGQVKHPGLVAYQRGKGYGYYIGQAGGFASGADLGGIRLVTAMNGQLVGAGGAEVRPGDIIWVPRKSDKGFWDVVKDVLTILAQAATIYIVVDQVTSK